MPNPLLNHDDRRSSHDQSADRMVSESVHTATFQPELAKWWVEVLIDHDTVHKGCLPFRLENKALRSAVQMRLQHLHNLGLDVDPAGCVPGLRRAHFLVVHALVDSDVAVYEQQIINGQGI